MKKFLLRCAFFALPIAVSLWVADAWLSNSIAKSRSFALGEVETWQNLEDGQMNLDFAVYGSSRAWTQVDIGMLETELGGNGFNFGLNAHNFWLQYLRHRMLLDQNKPPKLIIQTLDVQTLAKNKELVNPDQFLPFMFWDPRFEDFTDSYEGYSWIDYHVPLLRYYGKRKAITEAVKMTLFPNKDKPRRIKGYQGKDIVWTKDFENAQKSAVDRTVHFDAPSFKLFKDFLRECKAKHIKVVLVYCPDYVEGQDFFKNRKDEVMPLYRSVAKEFDVPFYDYSVEKISTQKRYFYNATHLNLNGAELFTRDLARRINDDKSLDLESLK